MFIAGNLPGLTEIVSLLIFIRLEEYSYERAAALPSASTLALIAVLTLAIKSALESRGWP